MTTRVTTPALSPGNRPTAKAKMKREAQRTLDAISRLEEWIEHTNRLVRPLGLLNANTAIDMMRDDVVRLKRTVMLYEADFNLAMQPHPAESASHPSASGSPRTS